MDNDSKSLSELNTSQQVSQDFKKYSHDSRDALSRDGGHGLEQGRTRVMDVNSLISLMKPLITSCRLLGIIHIRSNSSVIVGDGNRVFRKIEKLYSAVVMTVLWLDFARTLSGFRRDNHISRTLFHKILFSVWKFMLCSNITACFRACARTKGVFELLDEWTKEVEGMHQKVSSCRYLRWKYVIYTSICWLAVILNMVYIVFGTYYTNHFDLDYEPFEPDYKYIDVVKGVYIAIHLIRCCAWYLPVAVFYAICSLMGCHMFVLSEQFARIKHSEKALEQLEDIRQKHQRLCKLVEQADELVSPLLAIQFVSSVAMLCITLYVMVYPVDDADSDPLALLAKIFWFTNAGIALIIFCTGAAWVNCQVIFTSPVSSLYIHAMYLQTLKNKMPATFPIQAHGLLDHLYDIDLTQISSHQNSQVSHGFTCFGWLA